MSSETASGEQPGSTDSGPVPASLDEWNQALLDKFFPLGLAGHPVVFAVDDDELQQMTGLSGDAAGEALASVIRSAIMPGYRFEIFRRRGQRWLQRADPEEVPPFLALLALDVLAASRRDNKGKRGIASSYIPLRQLLSPGDDETGAPGTYGDVIPSCWEQLRQWLEVELEGRRGDPTIEQHPTFTWTGYGWNQALIRGSDQRAVLRFFNAVGLDPEDDSDVSGPELRSMLERWGRGKRGWAKRLSDLAADDDLAYQFEPFLSKAFASWDGTSDDARLGRASFEVKFLIPSRTAPGADFLQVVVPTGMGDYEFMDGAAALSSGEVPVENGFVRNGDAIAFRRDPGELGPDWLSTHKLRYGEKHLLLVRSSLRRALQEWLAEEPVAEGDIVPAATPMLPQGWLLFRNFGLTAVPQNAPPAGIAELVPSSGGVRTKLTGGLRIDGQARTYLEGGLPDVSLGDEVDPKLEIAWNSEALERSAASGSFALSAFPFGPGTVAISHESRHISFEIVAGVASAPSDLVGSVRSADMSGREASGLVVDGPGPKPPISVEVRSSGILLGPSPGDFEIVERPDWLAHVAGPLSWESVASWNGFSPVWFLNPTRLVASLLQPIEPVVNSTPGQWGRLLLRATLDAEQSSAAKALWDRYKEAAR